MKKTLIVLLLCLTYSQMAAASTLTEIRDAIVGKIAPDLDGMDLNDDGKVDIADLVFAARATGSMAEFETSFSETVEGRDVAVRVTFFPAFTGTLSYEVSGSAKADSDYAEITGSVLVDGKYADISITVNDDGSPEGIETIDLGLTAESARYFLGPKSRHTVNIWDNDAEWSGMIEHRTGIPNDGLRADIRMRIIQNASSANSGILMTDGMGIIPLNSVEPITEWPLNSLGLNETTFTATIDAVPISAPFSGFDNISGLTSAGPMERTFTFAADVEKGDIIDLESGRIVGTFTEAMSMPSRPAFGYTSQGVFILTREPTAVVEETP